MKLHFNVRAVLVVLCMMFAIGTMLTLSGCSGVQNVWFGDDTVQNNAKIIADFEKVPEEENLYYAKDTLIVYWIGGSYTNNFLGDDFTTSYITAWYAPNGKPYIYDLVAKQITQID